MTNEPKHTCEYENEDGDICGSDVKVRNIYGSAPFYVTPCYYCDECASREGERAEQRSNEAFYGG